MPSHFPKVVVLFSSFLFLTPIQGFCKEAPLLDMPCGTYSVTGYLRPNKQGHLVLQMNKNSLSPSEFLVEGGSGEQKIKLFKKLVEAEVYVPQNITQHFGKNLVYLQKIERATSVASFKPRLIQKEKCGLSEKIKK